MLISYYLYEVSTHYILHSDTSLSHASRCLEIITERLLTLLDSAIRVHGANFYYWHQTSVVHDYQKRLNIAEKNEYRLLAEAVIFYLERISEINIEDDLRVFHKVQSFKRLFTQQNKVTTVLSRIDVQRFEEYRDELFSNITSLEGMRTYAFMILS